MTNGTSQGLFVIVAVVIFGIFVAISYALFEGQMKTGLSTIFGDSMAQSRNALTGGNKETPSEKEEFIRIKPPKSFYNGSNSSMIMSGVIEHSVLNPNLIGNKDIFTTSIGANVGGFHDIRYTGNHTQKVKSGLNGGNQLKKPIITENVKSYTDMIDKKLPVEFKDKIYINSLSYTTSDTIKSVTVNGKEATFSEMNGEKLIVFDNLYLDLISSDTSTESGNSKFGYEGVDSLGGKLVGSEITDFENTTFNTTTTSLRYKPIQVSITNERGNVINLEFELSTYYMYYTK